jgi:uncharacterized protein YegP (UPF0339 family)
MAGKYVLKKTANDQYHFVLHAANGQVVAQSQTYTTKAAALAGIESVKANASSPTEDTTGE